MGRIWSGTSSYQSLISTYVDQTTTHGVRKITSSRNTGRKVFWIFIFLSSLSACCYHCSYLITMFASSPKVTITEEKDANQVEFPALTVCNLNIIKKSYTEIYFELTSKKTKGAKIGINASSTEIPKSAKNLSICYQSEHELIEQSAVDLSDTWLNLGITKDNLSRYGHRASDLIIQCTYNSKDCYDEEATFRTVLTSVTSPIFGLCHTLSIRNKQTNNPTMIKKGGTTQGIRLTLNIERDQYWDLISSEFGVRLLVHPQGTYPTLQRGGIIVSPGRSVHIGVKRRVSRLLPGRERTCTETFEDSLLIPTLKAAGLDFDLSDIKYTYEHCNTLCQNTLLFEQCGCLDEQPRTAIGHSVGWKFCNPCNKTQSKCRSNVLRNFSDNASVCDEICKPACRSIRYDVSLSKADWPNLAHQQLVMNRSRDQWNRVPEALGLLDLPFDDANISDFVNETFFSENLLRVHLFIEEMIYMSVEEQYSYQLPKLMADLGGCLGLYLGVSVISIIEIVEFFGCATIICLLRTGNHSRVQSSSVIRTSSLSKRKRRNRNRIPNENISSPFLNYRNSQRRSQGKKAPRASEGIWRPSVFSYQDPYYEDDSVIKRHQIRRF